ncbi:universal stress protein [Gordonia sp. NPDC003424]
MRYSKPVTVGVDGSSVATAAVEWAAKAAMLHQTSLTIVSALEAVSPPMVEYAIPALYFTDLKTVSEKILDEATGTARAASPDVDIHSEVMLDSARSALIAKSADSSLLVVGASGFGRVAAAVVGSVASGVASHAQCPVVILRDDSQAADVTGPVVVGIDGSPVSLHALDVAADEAAARSADLLVVSAWDTKGFDPTDTGFTAARAAVDTALAEPVGAIRKRMPDLTVTTRVLDESPQSALTQASVGASLLVVGSRGRGGFAGLLLGSTSQRLLHTAKAPLMIVHGN